jgi:hypothetical protein
MPYVKPELNVLGRSVDVIQGWCKGVCFFDIYPGPIHGTITASVGAYEADE